MMNKIIKTFNWFEWSMVLGMTLITAYFTALDYAAGAPMLYLFFSATAGISGVVCVVLVAKGKISNYIWGIYNVVAYAIIAWQVPYWGEVMLNMLYYLPMQFVGIYFWKRKLNKDAGTVESKVMTLPQLVGGGLLVAAAVYGYGLFLGMLGGSEPMLDSMSTVLPVVAMILMVARYAEQWLLWIVVNVVSVILWLLGGDMVMVAMWGIYLINAVYGWIIWKRGSKQLA